MNPTKTIPDGQRTKVIYSLIKEGKYQDVDIKYILRLSLILITNCSLHLGADPCPS